MQEQAVFGYFFPRKKVTRRKGGRGQKSHNIKWISPQFPSQAKPSQAKPSQAKPSQAKPTNHLPQQSVKNQ
ncbi:hypothetical protein [Pseudomonas sp. BP8]|uniref:hypothetical protein n=1 Tax=Pseudomonas sp. BP8 TaxID=2817864 RepID=UPI001AE6D073|nr:hypothetical protein [Pseudomonas sp. BP8]MBP2259756.1 hypothetical protein [Pseudomonas sp. BP8]